TPVLYFPCKYCLPADGNCSGREWNVEPFEETTDAYDDTSHGDKGIRHLNPITPQTVEHFRQPIRHTFVTSVIGNETLRNFFQGFLPFTDEAGLTEQFPQSTAMQAHQAEQQIGVAATLFGVEN